MHQCFAIDATIALAILRHQRVGYAAFRNFQLSSFTAVGSDSIVAMEHCRQQPDRGALLLVGALATGAVCGATFPASNGCKKGDLFLDLCASSSGGGGRDWLVLATSTKRGRPLLASTFTKGFPTNLRTRHGFTSQWGYSHCSSLCCSHPLIVWQPAFCRLQVDDAPTAIKVRRHSHTFNMH